MDVKPARFVQWVEAPAIEQIHEDAKAWTWEHEAEHMLLRLSTGERAVVRGGRDGIQFAVKGEGDERTLHMEIEGREVQVAYLYWHTHPRATGPSDGDLEALEVLKQDESVIYEIGGSPDGTRITPKAKPPNV